MHEEQDGKPHSFNISERLEHLRREREARQARKLPFSLLKSFIDEPLEVLDGAVPFELRE